MYYCWSISTVRTLDLSGIPDVLPHHSWRRNDSLPAFYRSNMNSWAHLHKLGNFSLIKFIKIFVTKQRATNSRLTTNWSGYKFIFSCLRSDFLSASYVKCRLQKACITVGCYLIAHSVWLSSNVTRLPQYALSVRKAETSHWCFSQTLSEHRN